MIVARVKAGLKKRKVKVFLLFLACSTLAWLINNLSQTFVSNTSFALEYSNTPEDFLLVNAPKESIDARLKAIGFQFMGFEIRKQNIQIDLSEVGSSNAKYYILPKTYKKQIENQLPKSMELMDLENDTLFIDLLKLESKQVFIRPRVNIDLIANYMLEDGIKVFPESVILKGPKNEVDTISSIATYAMNLTKVSADFSRKIALELPKGLSATLVSPDAVFVSGKVVRFSEKVLSVPVEMINVPDSLMVRMFPDQVQVLCQGKMAALKSIKITDLKVIADYDKIASATENRLPLVLDSFPQNLSKATLLTKEIEFILKRQ